MATSSYYTPIGTGLRSVVDALFGGADRQLLGLKAEGYATRNLANQLLAQQRQQELGHVNEAISGLRADAGAENPTPYSGDLLTGALLGKPSGFMSAVDTQRQMGEFDKLLQLYPLGEAGNIDDVKNQMAHALRGRNVNQMSLGMGNIAENVEMQRALTAIPDTHTVDQGLGKLPLKDAMGAFGNKTSLLNQDVKRDLIQAKTARVRTNEEIDQDVAEGRISVYEGQHEKLMAQISAIGMKQARNEEIHPYEIEELREKINLLEEKSITEQSKESLIQQRIVSLQNKDELIPLKKDLFGSKITYWDEKTNTEILRTDLVGKKIQGEVAKINKANAGKLQLKKHADGYFAFDPRSGQTMDVKWDPNIKLGKSDLTTQVIDKPEGGQEVVVFSKSEVYDAAKTEGDPTIASVGSKTNVKLQEETREIEAKTGGFVKRMKRLEFLLKHYSVTGLKGGANRLLEGLAKGFDMPVNDTASEAKTLYNELVVDIAPVLLKGLAPVSEPDIKRIEKITKGGLLLFEGKADARRSVQFLKDKMDAVRIKKGLKPVFNDPERIRMISHDDYKKLQHPAFRGEYARPEVQAIFRAKPNAVYHPLLNMYVIPTNNKNKPFKAVTVQGKVVSGTQEFYDFIGRNRR